MKESDKENIFIPIVTVVMITYGHENYIKKAINTVLNQKTKFKYELLIANDNSPDNSHKIILDVIKNNKNNNVQIDYLKNDNNIGMMPNFISALKLAKGKYIALCEGDDYWIDRLKLEKQVNFLDSNLDFNIVVSKYKLYFESNKSFRNCKELINIKKDLLLKHYLAFNFGHTSTFLFRNNFLLPNWFKDVHAGDQSLFVIAAKDKKIKYIDDFLSVYRINSTSISNTVNAHKSKENTLFFLSKVDEYTENKYKTLIKYRKILAFVYYYLESTKNKFKRVILKYILVIMRWFGSSVLVKFVK
jgi:glycosyltransferase involved in cell wall biosynthesis